MNWPLLKEWGVQVFLALDQLANALPPPIDGTVGYADETLSARCYRAHRDGKIFGRLFMRPIDLLFFWQGPGHCKNACVNRGCAVNWPLLKEWGVPIFESRSKGAVWR